MWEQDRAAGFSDRIASRSFLPRAPCVNLSGDQQRADTTAATGALTSSERRREEKREEKREQKKEESKKQRQQTEKEGEKKEEEKEQRKESAKPVAVVITRMVSVHTMPSLSSASPSSPSVSSASLDTRAYVGLEGSRNLLEDDGTGTLVVPRTAQFGHIYTCLFHILDCHETFDCADEWKTHVLSHFRTHSPPNTARCPLCPDERFLSGMRHSAWDRMMNHVLIAHYHQGQTLARSRPDFELMQYLYRLKIISDDQFKAMQLPPAPSSPAYHRSQDSVRASIGSADEPYCAPYSRRREERMRGRRRGISCV
ncbi:hypothetical protein ASPZODRAFT_132019 [Penicilliopsis zonata CBS 506.65]|uniref:Uncharacterized protein n=1 Tax=Penicilliopsis zonata CBS 506.65 TaxID=1073090 RepID=A0A1L9SIM9_9EURO|nr:hypothetical protein ASPZODRAFT_132019 [Penicilliopsis zonata CBS 506.65]OJJ47082.1 hypothetical protein ASPZODRAFT_132019 [Penicilliopsis zonata CBS 506.65]